MPICRTTCTATRRYLTLLALCFAMPAKGETLTWTLAGPASATTNSGVQGTAFTPNVDILVNALGIYDDTFSTPAGLAASHDVGLWEVASQNLVASATVPAGVAGTLINSFRFADVDPPVTLSAGVEYVVAAVGTGDPGRNVTPGSSMLVHPQITLGTWRADFGASSLVFPGSVLDVTTRRMGPSVCFTTAPLTCAADITGPVFGTPDGNVDSLDFLFLIAQWGTPCNGSCEADFTGPVGAPDGNVDSLDFLALIAQWGSPGNCP